MGVIINSVFKMDNGQASGGARFGRDVPDYSCLGIVSRTGTTRWPRLRGLAANPASNLD